jgi:hypothetical protein
MLSVWVRLQVREERLPEFEAGIAANAAEVPPREWTPS